MGQEVKAKAEKNAEDKILDILSPLEHQLNLQEITLDKNLGQVS
jgi:hypothetical protein